MDEMNYLDFDLHIHRSESGYRVKVVNSPAGQADGEFTLPFSDLEVENFILRVGRTRKGVRRLESPEMEAARQFGGRLFEAVFNDEIRGHLRSSLNEADQQDAGLRFRLHLSDTPELADLPWEYLYDSTLDEFIVLSVQTPLVRYLDLPLKTSTLTTALPLKVLVMISSPSDYPELDVEKEYQNLVEGLADLQLQGLVELVRLEEATLVNLQRQLRKDDYHIFHFIGHGGYDEKAEDGVLMLEDESGRGREVSGRYIGTMLHDQKTLRLAVLNACEGARTSSSDPFSGVAHSLVQKGIPAVIAMQFEITDEAAIVMAREFYGAIADGYPVDASLGEARKAVFAQNNDIEWGTPVLYMRSPDGHIFGVDRSTASAAVAAAGEVHEHDGVAHTHGEPVDTTRSTAAPAAAGMAAAGSQAVAPPPAEVSGGGGDSIAGKPPMQAPTGGKRSILPWLIGLVSIAALITAALLFFNASNQPASGPPSEPNPGAVAEISPTATETTVPEASATLPPTSTQPAPTVEEVQPLIADTGATPTPTLAETIESTPTEEPEATIGSTPVGGSLDVIAFASNESGNIQIWTINVDGSNPKKITDITGGACQPAWSPDGMRLVFTSPCDENKEKYENSALYLIDIDGSGQKRLTEGYAPSWAPNDLIVFTADLTNQTTIYTIDPDREGEQPIPLTQFSNNFRPDWSPDGEQIAFVSTRLGPVPVVFTMPALGEIAEGGGSAKNFSASDDFAYDQPRFSPQDGFLMFTKSTYPQNNSGRLELMGAKLGDRKNLRLVTNSEVIDRPINEADYSADGKWIVFESWTGSIHDIYVMNSFGSNVRPVTQDEFYNFDAAWQPIQEP